MSGLPDIGLRIPDEYDPEFMRALIKDVLRLSDSRNAKGVGISISGSADEVATYTSTTLDEAYIVAVASEELTNERVLAGENTVISITDGGANSTITVGVETNGLDFEKLQQIATSTYLGRVTAGTGDIGAITTNTAFNKDFGTVAGTVLEGDTTAADIGAQPLDDTLTTIAATNPTTDEINYFTGTNVASVTSLTAFARTLIDDTTQGAMQTTLDVDPSGTDNSTNVTLAGTPDYLSLSGQQITLNEIDLTTDVDGYQTGNWTPIIEGGSTTGTYTSATGTSAKFVKVGSQVWVTARVTFSAIIAGTGNLHIRGIPFNYANGARPTGAIAYSNLNLTTATPATVVISSNSSGASDAFHLDECRDNAAPTITLITGVSTSTILWINMTYFTAL